VDHGLSGAGPLKDVLTGKTLGVTVTVTNQGATLESGQGVPDYGTPASVVFDGFWDFGGKAHPWNRSWDRDECFTYTFSGLDPGAE